MRHAVIGEKSVLLGDRVTDLLVQYAALLVEQRSADSTEVAAVDSTGASTLLTLLLGPGMTFVAEQVASDLPEPDNRKAEQLLRSRIESLIRHQTPSADEIAGTEIWNVEQAE